MKRIIVLALTVLLALSLFSGCNSNKETDVKANGKLVIGLDDTFAPMGFRDDKNELVGFDIDLAREVCNKLGVEAVFQTINWKAKEMELKSGKVDCLWNGMSKTPEREKNMSLTNPYLNNKIIIMTNEGVQINSKDDLASKNIGIQAGSAALEAVKADEIYETVKDKIYEYPTYDEAILDMKSGRLDCLVIDEVYGSYKNAKLGNIYGVSEVNFGDDLYVIGFRKEDSKLAQTVNDIIKELIKEGKAAEISNKWFGKNIVIE